MKKYYIATTNEGKIKEIGAAFQGEDVELLPLEINFDELEDELKKEGVRDMEIISKAKARVAFQSVVERDLEVLPVIVDDTGIYFEKLGDEPGIDTKSFVKKHGGIEGLKNNIQEGDRAFFQSVISYMDQGMVEPRSFIGRVGGRLSARDDAQEIEGGFPFNHVFIPDGRDEFLYQIPIEERKKFSHRFQAAASLKEFLLEKTEKETRVVMR